MDLSFITYNLYTNSSNTNSSHTHSSHTKSMLFTTVLLGMLLLGLSPQSDARDWSERKFEKNILKIDKKPQSTALEISYNTQPKSAASMYQTLFRERTDLYIYTQKYQSKLRKDARFQSRLQSDRKGLLTVQKYTWLDTPHHQKRPRLLLQVSYIH